MGKSSGGIRNAGKNTRKNLTSEQNKEFHNAAALGLFNSAVWKGDENLRKVESEQFGIGNIISVAGKYAMVNFNGEIKKMLVQFLKEPKIKKEKAYLKKETNNDLYNYKSIVNSIKGSRSDRGSMFAFSQDDIFNKIEKLAREKKHFTEDIINKAKKGQYISDKQAAAVAMFAKNNNLISR